MLHKIKPASTRTLLLDLYDTMKWDKNRIRLIFRY